MANTKVTGNLIASGTITADNLVSGTLDTLLNSYLTTNTYATQSYVTTAVNNLIDAAPASLDTLNELAAALNDDANFATTVTNSLATKLNLSGGTLTGDLIINEKIGIGISSGLTYPLTIQGATGVNNSYIHFVNTTTGTAFTDGTQIGVPDGQSYFLINQREASDIRINVGGSERMRIDSSGNIGIGTSSPDASLTVVGGAIRSKDTDGEAGFDFYQTISGGLIRMRDNKPVAIYTNNTERLRVDSSGNVGIGTNSPVVDLHIKGNNGLILEDDGTTNHFRIQTSNAGDAIFYNGTSPSSPTETMRIKSTGTIQLPYASDTGALNTGSGVITDPGTYTGMRLYGSGDGNFKLFNLRNNSAYGNIIFYTGASSERMRVDYLGNVGIGTSSPQERLDTGNGAIATTTISGRNYTTGLISSQNPNIVNGSGFNSIPIRVGDIITFYGGQVRTVTSVTDTQLTVNSAWTLSFAGVTATGEGSLGFNTSNTERMHITSGGYVLFNNSTSGHIDNANNVSILSTIGRVNIGSNSTASSVRMYFTNPNGAVGNILTSNSSTSYNTASDYRLKENVIEMIGALDRVDALKPSRFNFIADPKKTVDGFLAHEVAEVVPEAISGEKDAMDEEGNPVYQGIDQSKLVPLLVGAIKELKAEIQTLKSQINA